MSEIKGFRLIDINLSQQRSSEFQGPSRQVLITSAVAGVLFLLYLIWGFAVQSNLDDLDGQLAEGETQINSLQSQLQQMNANGRLDVWKDLPHAIERANRPPLELMKAFSRHLPADASVNSWMMDGTNLMKVEVDFGSTESFIRFKSTIAKEASFRMTDMQSFTNKPVGDSSAGNYLPVTTVNFVFEVVPAAETAGKEVQP